MLSPAEALAQILEHAAPLGDEEAAVSPALAGRVLSADVTATVSLPPFATSAMDGYAVRAAELGDGPVPIAFRLAAGDAPRPLPAGAAAGIATGAPMPPGADAVVPVEDAEEVDGALAAGRPEPGAHIRPAGGDVEAGRVVAAAGRVLTPALLAAVAAVGTAAVRVARRPRLAAIATGSELVRAGTPLQPGQIYESNLTAIVAQSERAGAELVAARTVPDDRTATEAAFAAALEADVVVSSGGVSVGPHDHVKGALDALGVREVFWRVAHKPGKPLWFGVAPQGALVFGVPGNPVSSLVCFELFVRPALRALQGAPQEPRPVARLAGPVARLESRDHAVRCRLRPGDAGMELEPGGPQDSHLIVHAAGADAVALIAAGTGEVPAGTLVEYLPL
ncbi:MAG TPA: gephyrin-like molybdotransferase Glp [Gaiellales bacterium]|nr:gephyrin-like molybdotransferase Glp [Gaiellales bacterium]